MDVEREEKPQSGWSAVGKPAAAIRRRKIKDRLAKWVVGASGITIIAGVLGILVFILLEVAPLFRGARSEAKAPLAAPVSGLMVGVEEYEEVGYTLTTEGLLEFFRLPGGAREAKPLRSPVTCAWKPLGSRLLALGGPDGTFRTADILFMTGYEDDPAKPAIPRRVITHQVTESDPVRIDPEGKPLVRIVHQVNATHQKTAAITGDGRLILLDVVEKKSMMGKPKRTEVRHDLTSSLGAAPTSIALDHFLETLIVGTATGGLVHFDLREPEPRLLGRHSGGSAAITATEFLNGDVTLVTGDQAGRVTTWFQVNDPAAAGSKMLAKINEFTPHASAVTSITASSRDKGFATSDKTGTVMVRHATSAQTLLTLKGADSPARHVLMSPRANGVYALHDTGAISRWSLDNPHLEITMETLFGKVHYEGADKPEHVWQSTGGTDDFEPKFGMSPLIFGTLKGTFYALIIAVPLSILGAIYTASFLHPSLKAIVKPTIEVMAALPSVVLGFLAGLWLAPVMERLIPAILIMFVMVPLSAIVALGAWKLLPLTFRHRFHERAELGFLLVALLVAGWLSIQMNGAFEAWLFKGDFRQWWFGTTGLLFDQRNAFVVGFAMGFAVIPIIFTISEDALSNVPRHLTSGSLALGATPWQTAIRVVLPTASPGIFSAIMIGFGRVVGETMIVLMATGNTPIMEWNLFNGFRTLSANIAVEVPEAPHGGTLYRTLFLGALLLFIATFALNTVAEIVRQRMRKRYAQL